MAGSYKTLPDMIDRSVRSYGKNRCFGTRIDGHYRWITYAEFGTQLERLRGGLSALEVKPGDRVSIIANNRVEWAAACYATQQLGAAFAPMYESQTTGDWEYILKDSTPTVLIVSTPRILERVESIVRRIPAIKAVVLLEGQGEGARPYRDVLNMGHASPVPVNDVSPDALATLIYTSGTTGKPKGVMLSHANIISNVNAIHALFPVSQEDISLSFLPWAHSFGHTVELHVMLSYGASIGLAERVDTIMQNLLEVRPTVLFSVPRVFNKVYDGLYKKMAQESPLKRRLFYAGLKNATRLRERRDAGRLEGLPGLLDLFYDRLIFSKIRERLGGRLKYAISGGAALSKEVAMFIDNLNILVFEGYGLSETAPIATANSPDYRRIGSIGKPLPGVTIKLDTSVASEDPGVGELINYGPNTMLGYFNMQEESERVMTPDGGFRTGDLGYFDKDGYLYITGRVKEQYKLENGKYVAPVPLEEALQLSPYINQAMVDGVGKPGNVALIVLDVPALEEYCAEKGLDVSSPEKMAAQPEVKALIRGEIERLAGKWKGYERIRAFHLLTEEWSVDNDMLTPSLKLKRRNVVKNYQAILDSLYQEF